MADDKLHTHLSRLEAPELIDAAAKIAGFDLGTRPTFGTAANVSGVRTRTHTFSRRRHSLTIFATDSRYGLWGAKISILPANCRFRGGAPSFDTPQVLRTLVLYT